MNPAQFWALCEIHCYRSNVHKHKECFFGRKYFLRNSIWPRGSRPLKRWESGHSRDFPRTGVIKWGFTAPKSAFSKYNIFVLSFLRRNINLSDRLFELSVIVCQAYLLICLWKFLDSSLMIKNDLWAHTWKVLKYLLYVKIFQHSSQFKKLLTMITTITF